MLTGALLSRVLLTESQIGFTYQIYKIIRFFKYIVLSYAFLIPYSLNQEHSMADQKRKIDTIRRIEHLQLSEALIVALDDAVQAESVAAAIQSLQGLTEQWN